MNITSLRFLIFFISFIFSNNSILFAQKNIEETLISYNSYMKTKIIKHLENSSDHFNSIKSKMTIVPICIYNTKDGLSDKPAGKILLDTNSDVFTNELYFLHDELYCIQTRRNLKPVLVCNSGAMSDHGFNEDYLQQDF